MSYMINHPRVLACICLLLMWLVSWCGVWIRLKLRIAEDADKSSLGLVVGATLTLLGLIIGFTFSMAATRYDQRRLYEEGEANAIGTEYARADLLPSSQALETRQLLRDYLDRRIDFFRADYGAPLDTANEKTSEMQSKLWHSVQSRAASDPNPVTALVVSGMNDVLNSQGYTQFSFWNRIPPSVWGLMIAISIFSNLLVGYSTRRSRSGAALLLVLPVIVAVSFFLISDIDSPRGGLIRVEPLDLKSLAQALHKTSQ